MLINDEIMIMIKKYQKELDSGEISKNIISYIDYLEKTIDRLELENIEMMEVINNIKK